MGKLIDMTGWKMWEHGVPDSRWMVLSKAETPAGQTKAHWLVECSCEKHTQKVISGTHLRKGTSLSCGCMRAKRYNEDNISPLLDLTGYKMEDLGVQNSRWYVLSKGPIGPEKQKQYYCQCTCGNVKLVRATNLRSGKSLSCGCYASEQAGKATINDLTGQKFGLLTVIRRAGTKIYNGGSTATTWWCQCDCGSSPVEVVGKQLKSGETVSCGCLKTSLGEAKIQTLLQENNIKYNKEKTFKDFIYAETKGIPRFDFYLPDQNCVIEFDGSHHYRPEQYGNMTLEQAEQKHIQTKKCDIIKNQYCLDNNITLIRIPYWHCSKLCLEDLLPETSTFIIKEEAL